MLSPRLLYILRTYWRRARPSVWLFQGQEPGNHVSTGALQDACRRARKQARIDKPVTAYVAAKFRHPSPGGWRRHSHHSGVARPCRPVFDDALWTCRHEPDRQHAVPLRSTLMPVGLNSRRACVRSWRWRTFSAATATRFALRRATGSPSINARSWPRSRHAERRRSAVMSSGARIAARSASPTILAAIGIPRSARVWRASNGLQIAAPNCCPLPISMSSSPCRRQSRRSLSRTRRSSTTSCSRRPPRRSASSPPTPKISVPRPA